MPRWSRNARIEAATLFNDASGLEQWLLTNRASARVDRFLAAPLSAAPASSLASAADR